MDIKKINRKFLKYGPWRSVLVIFRKVVMQPLGLLRLYNKRYASRQERFKPGTRKWLIATEAKYGGRVSTEDHNGGDRMSFWWHNYASDYERALLPFLQKNRPVTLIEVVIFQGTGVAIWSELFQNGRVIGLDLKLDYIKNNMDNLKEKGAFQNNNLELYDFDQYKDNKEHLSNILKGDKVDVVIDDGDHKSQAIMNTFKNMIPFLSDEFVYIIEDNDSVFENVREHYPEFKVRSHGEITVITPKDR